MDTGQATTGQAGAIVAGARARRRLGRRGGGAAARTATVAVALVVVLVAAVGVWPGGNAASAAGARPRGAAAALAAAGALGTQGYGAGGQYQLVPGDQPSLIALGTGEGSAPAEGATMQVLVRANDGSFGPSMGSQDAPPPVPAGPTPLTEGQVQPVVDAVVAAGAPEGAVEVVISPPFGGQFGVGSAQVLIEMEEGDLDSMLDIAEAASAAAPEAGLFLETVNAAYEVADCAPLLREARQSAADDARARAEGLAEVLGLTLGDVLLATETPGYAGVPGIGCAADPAASQFSGKGGGYLPLFDPSLPAEVEIYAQITLAYAIS